MSHKISDQFTHLDISRQRKYQMRKKKAGLCEQCPCKAIKWGLCKVHVVKKRKERRKLHRCKKAYECLTSELERELSGKKGH